MSDFLSRLVQRTRGEAAVLRPVSHAVTAPDPGGVAWDEQSAVREAPPLARPMHAARSSLELEEGPSLSELAASPRVQRRSPRSMHPKWTPPAVVESTRALAPEPSVAAPLASAPSARLRAPELRELPQSELVRARASEVSVTAPAARREEARIAVESARQNVVDDALAPLLAPSLPAAARSLDRGLRLAEPSAGERPVPIEAAPGLAPVRAHLAEDVAFHAHAEEAPTVVAQRAAEGATQAGPKLAVAARATPVDAAAQQPRARRKEAGAELHEHSTTVEVSIGRIEVRLPQRPRAAVDEPPSFAPRRAAVGLDAYLSNREADKAR